MDEAALRSFGDLNEVIERLRAPGGCPWDRAQTHQSLRPHLLEEAHEALEAIDSGAQVRLEEELGDLLLQVLMHCAIAQEQSGGFDIGDVAEVLRRKMVGRHPHVFGETTVAGAGEVVVNWERLKAAEKTSRISLLDGVPASLPALAAALAVQKRPARVGFDLTPTVATAMAALRDAVAAAEQVAGAATDDSRSGEDWEAGSALETTSSSSIAEEVIGDLLFAVVALARRLRVNPEDALRRRSGRSATEFRAVEEGVRAEGGDVHATTPEQWARRRSAATME
ncbi:MAG: nucleoside triphosphate pyrophosphohydrolase [Candidatus Dormibacteria bacterium]